MGFGKCHLFFGCDIMKFFIISLFLLLLFDSPQGSTLTHRRSVRGLNTTLQTNFNGTYERRNPCTNAEIETTSYVASHEFHHHTKEDDWSDYSRRCSAIISGFLQAIGNLVRFNNKQNGTFNFHINTSISQKQDGVCNPSDQKSCNSLPTIIIQATDGEISPKRPTENVRSKTARPCDNIRERAYFISGSSDGNKIRKTITSTQFPPKVPLNQGSQKPTTSYWEPTTVKSQERVHSESYPTFPSENTPISIQETTSYRTQPATQSFERQGIMQQEENMSTPDMLLTGTQTANTVSPFLPLLTDTRIAGIGSSSPAVLNDFSSTTQSDFYGSPKATNLQHENYVTNAITTRAEDKLTTACPQTDREPSSLNPLDIEKSSESDLINPQKTKDIHSISSPLPSPGSYKQGTQFNFPKTTANLPIYYSTQQTVTEPGTLSTENQLIQNQFPQSSIPGQPLQNAEQPFNDNLSEKVLDSSQQPPDDRFKAITDRTPVKSSLGSPQKISPAVLPNPNVSSGILYNDETSQGKNFSPQPVESSYAGTPLSPRVTRPVGFSQAPYEANSFSLPSQSPNVIQTENIGAESSGNAVPFQQTQQTFVPDASSPVLSSIGTPLQTEIQTASTPEYDELSRQMTVTQPPLADDDLVTEPLFNYGGQTQPLSQVYPTPTTPTPPFELPSSTLTNQNMAISSENTPVILPSQFPTQTSQYSQPTPIADSTLPPQSDFSLGPSSVAQSLNGDQFSDPITLSPNQRLLTEQTTGINFNEFPLTISPKTQKNSESQLIKPPLSDQKPDQNSGESIVSIPTENTAEQYPITPDLAVPVVSDAAVLNKNNYPYSDPAFNLNDKTTSTDMYPASTFKTVTTPQVQQYQPSIIPESRTPSPDFSDDSSIQQTTGNVENVQYSPTKNGEVSPNQFQTTLGPDSSYSREMPTTFFTPSTQFKGIAPFSQFPTTIPAQQPIRNYEMLTPESNGVGQYFNETITTQFQPTVESQGQSSQSYGNDETTSLPTSKIYNQQTPKTFVQPDFPLENNAALGQMTSTFPPQQQPLDNYETTQSRSATHATYTPPLLQATTDSGTQLSEQYSNDAVTGLTDSSFYGQKNQSPYAPVDSQLEGNAPFSSFPETLPPVSEQQQDESSSVPTTDELLSTVSLVAQSSYSNADGRVTGLSDATLYDQQSPRPYPLTDSQLADNKPLTPFASTLSPEEQTVGNNDTPQNQPTSTVTDQDSWLRSSTVAPSKVFYSQQNPNTSIQPESQIGNRAPFDQYPTNPFLQQQPVGYYETTQSQASLPTAFTNSLLPTTADPRVQPSEQYPNDEVTEFSNSPSYDQQNPTFFVPTDSQLSSNGPITPLLSTLPPVTQRVGNYDVPQDQFSSGTAPQNFQLQTSPDSQLESSTVAPPTIFSNQRDSDSLLQPESQQFPSTLSPQLQPSDNYEITQSKSTLPTDSDRVFPTIDNQEVQPSAPFSIDRVTGLSDSTFYGPQTSDGIIPTDSQVGSNAPFTPFTSTLSPVKQPVENYDISQTQSTSADTIQDTQFQTSANPESTTISASTDFNNLQSPNRSILPDSQFGTNVPFTQFPSTPIPESLGNYEMKKFLSISTPTLTDSLPQSTAGPVVQPSIQYPNEGVSDSTFYGQQSPNFFLPTDSQPADNAPFLPFVSTPSPFQQPVGNYDISQAQPTSVTTIQDSQLQTQLPSTSSPVITDSLQQSTVDLEPQSSEQYPNDEMTRTADPTFYNQQTPSSFPPTDLQLVSNTPLTPFASPLSPVQQPIGNQMMEGRSPSVPTTANPQYQTSAIPQTQPAVEYDNDETTTSVAPVFYDEQTPSTLIQPDSNLGTYNKFPLTVLPKQQPLDNNKTKQSQSTSLQKSTEPQLQTNGAPGVQPSAPYPNDSMTTVSNPTFYSQQTPGSLPPTVSQPRGNGLFIPNASTLSPKQQEIENHSDLQSNVNPRIPDNAFYNGQDPNSTNQSDSQFGTSTTFNQFPSTVSPVLQPEQPQFSSAPTIEGFPPAAVPVDQSSAPYDNDRATSLSDLTFYDQQTPSSFPQADSQIGSNAPFTPFASTVSPAQPAGNYDVPQSQLELGTTVRNIQLQNSVNSQSQSSTEAPPAVFYSQRDPYQFPPTASPEPIRNYERTEFSSTSATTHSDPLLQTTADPKARTPAQFINDGVTESADSALYTQKNPSTFIPNDSQVGNNVPFTPFASTLSPVQQPVENYDLPQDKSNPGFTIQDPQLQTRADSQFGSTTAAPPAVSFNHQDPNSWNQSDSQLGADEPFHQFPKTATSFPQQQPLGNFEANQFQSNLPTMFTKPLLETTAGSGTESSVQYPSDRVTGVSDPAFNGQQTQNPFAPTDSQLGSTAPFSPYASSSPEPQLAGNQMPEDKSLSLATGSYLSAAPEFQNSINQLNQFPSSLSTEQPTTGNYGVTQPSPALYSDSLLQTNVDSAHSSFQNSDDGVTGNSAPAVYGQQTSTTFAPTNSQLSGNEPFTPLASTLLPVQQPVGNYDVSQDRFTPSAAYADSQLQSSTVPESQVNDDETELPVSPNPTFPQSEPQFDSNSGKAFYDQQTPNTFISTDSQVTDYVPLTTVAPEQQTIGDYDTPELKSSTLSPFDYPSVTTQPIQTTEPELLPSQDNVKGGIKRFPTSLIMNQQTPSSFVQPEPQVVTNAASPQFPSTVPQEYRPDVLTSTAQSPMTTATGLSIFGSDQSPANNFPITPVSSQVPISNENSNGNLGEPLSSENRMLSQTSDIYPPTTPIEYEPTGPIQSLNDVPSELPNMGSDSPYTIGQATDYSLVGPNSFAPEKPPNYSQIPDQFEQRPNTVKPLTSGVSRGTQTDFSPQTTFPYRSENVPLVTLGTTLPPISASSAASVYSEEITSSNQEPPAVENSTIQVPKQTQEQFLGQPSSSDMTSSIPEAANFDEPALTSSTPFNVVNESQSEQDSHLPLEYPNQLMTDAPKPTSFNTAAYGQPPAEFITPSSQQASSYSDRPQSLDSYSRKQVTVSDSNLLTQSPDLLQNENQPFTPAPTFSTEPEPDVPGNPLYETDQTGRLANAAILPQQTSDALVNIPPLSGDQSDSATVTEQVPYLGTTAIPAGPQGNFFPDYNKQLTSNQFDSVNVPTTVPQEFKDKNQMFTFSPSSDISNIYPPVGQSSTKAPFQPSADSFFTPQPTPDPNTYVSYDQSQPNSPLQSQSLISTAGNDQPLPGTFQPSYVPESQTETTLPYSSDPSVDTKPSFVVSEQGPLDAPTSTTPQLTGNQNIKQNDFQAFTQPEIISPGYTTSISSDYPLNSDSSVSKSTFPSFPTFPTFPTESSSQLDTSLLPESNNNRFPVSSTPSSVTYNSAATTTSLNTSPYSESFTDNSQVSLSSESQPTGFTIPPNYYPEINTSGAEFETNNQAPGKNLPLNYPEQTPVAVPETTLPSAPQISSPFVDEINKPNLKSQNAQEEMQAYPPSLAPQPQPQPSPDYTTEIADYKTNDNMGQKIDNTTPFRLNPKFSTSSTNTPTAFQSELPTFYPNDQAGMNSNSDFPLPAAQPENFNYPGYPQSDSSQTLGTTDMITGNPATGLTTSDSTSTSYQTFPKSTIKPVASINPVVSSLGPYETLPTSESIDNVSPQFQPTTAVNYGEETNAYHTTPVPRPQTTMKYANELSDDNIGNFTPDELVTTSPNFAPTSATSFDQSSVIISETPKSDRSIQYQPIPVQQFTGTQQLGAVDSQAQYTTSPNEQLTDYPLLQDSKSQTAEDNLPLYNNQQNFQPTENQQPQTTPAFYGQFQSKTLQARPGYLNSAATPEYSLPRPEEPFSNFDQQADQQTSENQISLTNHSQNYSPISDSPFATTTQGTPIMNYDQQTSTTFTEQPTNPSYSVDPTTPLMTNYPPSIDYSNQPGDLYTSRPREAVSEVYNQPRPEISQSPQPNSNQSTKPETPAYSEQSLNDRSTPLSDSLISSPSPFGSSPSLVSDFPPSQQPMIIEPDTQTSSSMPNTPMSSSPTFEQQSVPLLTPTQAKQPSLTAFATSPQNFQIKTVPGTDFPVSNLPMSDSGVMTNINNHQFVPTEQGTTPVPVYGTTESSSYSESEAVYNVRNRPNGRLFDGKALPFDTNQQFEESNQSSLPPIPVRDNSFERPKTVENPTSSSSFADYSTQSSTAEFTEYDETTPMNLDVLTDGQPIYGRTTEKPDPFSSQPAVPQTDSPLDFEERSTGRPIIFTSSSEPSTNPPQQQHLNPLLQSLESHLFVPSHEPSKPSTTASFPESSSLTPTDSFSFEPQHGISSAPPYIPRREFDRNFVSPQSQPNAGVTTQDVTITPQPDSHALVSDLTTPSNKPGENCVSCSGHHGNMSSPLLCPFDPVLKGNMTAPSYYILISKLPVDDDKGEHFKVEKVYLGDGTPLNCSLRAGETFPTSLYTKIPFRSARTTAQQQEDSATCPDL